MASTEKASMGAERRTIDQLEAELVQRTTERDEGLAREAAVAEVLKTISRSAFDLPAMLQTVVSAAHRLCQSDYSVIFRKEGDVYRWAAGHGISPEYEERERQAVIQPGTETIIGRAVLAGHAVQIADAKADPLYLGEAESDAHAMLGVPLLRDGVAIGGIGMARNRVEPFTERQVQLVATFADQAVIAIENARLITETRDALDQQTATAEVLQVINRSPGELTPVFDAILEKAFFTCGAAHGTLTIFDGELFRVVASRGLPESFERLLRQPFSRPAGTPEWRLVAGERYVHLPDIATPGVIAEGNPFAHEAIEVAGIRTLLFVPLRKDSALLGFITVHRTEVRPFSDKEIALIENFAAQAVIAIENARLITETREALEQQTATAEVLAVINSSPGDLVPVFEAIAETATRLCQADFAIITNREVEGFRVVATAGNVPEYDAVIRGRVLALDRGSVSGRAAIEQQAVQVADIAADPEHTLSEAVTLAKCHTTLAVPFLRDGSAVGTISLGRQRVQLFTERQIDLVSTFADQAAIAIANARLLSEIRQRQQELRVTFDNMVDGVVMFDEKLHLAAWNRNFQELLDLPEDFFTEPHDFETYIRYLTGRGEFGAEGDPEAEMARLRPRFGDHYSFVRERPDGRVIEVRHNPMPDGGFVLIYSDITERKRSEEEIRAARDAAEAAYRDLQAAQASLVQAQKMAALGQLTAGIAHEIKNPLNFVNNFASLSNELLGELKEQAEPALATLDDDKRAEIDETMVMLSGNLEKIAEHGQRADNIVKSMLEHSRGVSGERREVDLNGLIEEALNLAYHGARAQDQSFNITLERDYAQALKPIELVPQEMTRVFLNLFDNGFYAADKRAKASDGNGYRPTLSVTTRAAEAAVEVRVRDNGTGIPADIREKLFQPFFTTKPTGEGTGLGLSISYDIVTQQHGGTIEVASEEGAYTEFTIRLPRH
jgi:signal transduction histidine kinase